MKAKVLMLTAAMVLMASTVALAAVANTPHDLATTGGAVQGTSDQPCVYCHTPHGGNSAADAAPLWNKAYATGSFTLYDSPTMNATSAQPGGVSKACLSCHDGSTSVGAVLNLNGAASSISITPDGTTNKATYSSGSMTAGVPFLGTTLANDHPVGFDYTQSDAADAGIQAIGSVTLPLFGASSNIMECGTCHNAHDNTNTNFLRVTNAGSAMCKSCHINK